MAPFSVPASNSLCSRISQHRSQFSARLAYLLQPPRVLLSTFHLLILKAFILPSRKRHRLARHRPLCNKLLIAMRSRWLRNELVVLSGEPIQTNQLEYPTDANGFPMLGICMGLKRFKNISEGTKRISLNGFIGKLLDVSTRLYLQNILNNNYSGDLRKLLLYPAELRDPIILIIFRLRALSLQGDKRIFGLKSIKIECLTILHLKTNNLISMAKGCSVMTA